MLYVLAGCNIEKQTTASIGWVFEKNTKRFVGTVEVSMMQDRERWKSFDQGGKQIGKIAKTMELAAAQLF